MKIALKKTSTLVVSMRPLLLLALLYPVGLMAQTKNSAAAKVEPPAASDTRKLTAADFLKAAQEQKTAHAKAASATVPDKAEPVKVKKTPPVVVAIANKTATTKPASVTEPATKQPILYDRHGRLIVPKPLKGTHEILLHQNEMADDEGLDRIQDDDDLEAMRAKKLLVALPVNQGLRTDERLPMNRRYSRPWTAKFLADVARAHYARFHQPLQVNSAVRTADFQLRLIQVNGNAAPADGDTASPHLTGQAVDIAKHGLSRAEIAWMRSYLMPLIAQGKVDVEEEFQQACFHVSVYRRYAPPPAKPKRTLVARKTNKTTEMALVAAVR